MDKFVLKKLLDFYGNKLVKDFMFTHLHVRVQGVGNGPHGTTFFKIFTL